MSLQEDEYAVNVMHTEMQQGKGFKRKSPR